MLTSLSFRGRHQAETRLHLDCTKRAGDVFVSRLVRGVATSPLAPLYPSLPSPIARIRLVLKAVQGPSDLHNELAAAALLDRQRIQIRISRPSLPQPPIASTASLKVISMPYRHFRPGEPLRWPSTDPGGMARALVERKDEILNLQRKLADRESLLSAVQPGLPAD